MNNLKAVVVGAGMGGLATAIALRQAGYKVEIYDRVSELRPAGAGISLWSNGVKVLNRLGLGKEIAEIGGPMNRMTYFDKSGKTLTDFSLDPLVEAVGQHPYPVARTDLQQMLLTALGEDQVQLNSKCVAVEQTADDATAIFADGRRVTGDVVVGADGTHSVVREHVLGKSTQRRYAGYVNWNGLVKADEKLADKESWVIYVGDAQRASLMPVGGDRFYFFFDVPLPFESEPADDPQTELAEHFKGWAEPVQKLISMIDSSQVNRVKIHDIEPLPAFVKGRVGLIGDAGHSTTPDLGQGGCQAFEDAWVLANSLLTTNLSVEDALKRYEGLRRDRTANIILKARKRANMIHGKEPDRTKEWYENLAKENGDTIIGAISDLILQGPMR
ncbi:MAG: FAD-dependent urate hydroxylase HpxO [Phormidesmis sp.]